MSKIQITPAWKDVKPSGFYVYIHRRATDGSVFYVGRGVGNRGWQAYSGYRSPWWKRVASKNGVIVDVAQDCMTSDGADLLEEWLIAKYRAAGERIVNITSGGGGTVGWSPSPETRDKIGEPRRKPVENSAGMYFPSASSAAHWIGENTKYLGSQASISNACNGYTNQAYGYAWWWSGDSPKEYTPRSETFRKSRGRPILRSDGVIYDSLSSAANGVNGSVSSICASARSEPKRVYRGFTWSYA